MKGKKTGGRVAGVSKNKLGTIRDAVALAFDGLGGHKALQKWAQEHQSEFYTKIATRMIPQELTGSTEAPLPLRIELTHATETTPDPNARLSKP